MPSAIFATITKGTDLSGDFFGTPMLLGVGAGTSGFSETLDLELDSFQHATATCNLGSFGGDVRFIVAGLGAGSSRP